MRRCAGGDDLVGLVGRGDLGGEPARLVASLVVGDPEVPQWTGGLGECEQRACFVPRPAEIPTTGGCPTSSGSSPREAPSSGSAGRPTTFKLHRTGVKRLRHPLVGEPTLDFEALELSGDPGQSMLIYTAEPASPTCRSLDLKQT